MRLVEGDISKKPGAWMIWMQWSSNSQCCAVLSVQLLQRGWKTVATGNISILKTSEHFHAPGTVRNPFLLCFAASSTHNEVALESCPLHLPDDVTLAFRRAHNFFCNPGLYTVLQTAMKTLQEKEVTVTSWYPSTARFLWHFEPRFSL